MQSFFSLCQTDEAGPVSVVVDDQSLCNFIFCIGCGTCPGNLMLLSMQFNYFVMETTIFLAFMKE